MSGRAAFGCQAWLIRPACRWGALHGAPSLRRHGRLEGTSPSGAGHRQARWKTPCSRAEDWRGVWGSRRWQPWYAARCGHPGTMPRHGTKRPFWSQPESLGGRLRRVAPTSTCPIRSIRRSFRQRKGRASRHLRSQRAVRTPQRPRKHGARGLPGVRAPHGRGAPSGGGMTMLRILRELGRPAVGLAPGRTRGKRGCQCRLHGVPPGH